MNDLEKATALVHYLIQCGYALSLDNGGTSLVFPFTTNAEKVIEHLNETGQDFLITKKDGRTRYIDLVYQGEPESLITDYSIDLDQLIAAFENTMEILTTVGAH